jgi:hypothetical protein
MHHRSLFSAVALALLCTAAAQAQQAPVPASYDVVLPATSPTPTFAPHRPALTVEAQQQPRSRRWEGAVIGGVVFAAAAHLFLYSGDSTSLCNRERNQDAIRRNECNAIIAGSALVGAGAGYLVGSRIRVGRR